MVYLKVSHEVYNISLDIWTHEHAMLVTFLLFMLL